MMVHTQYILVISSGLDHAEQLSEMYEYLAKKKYKVLKVTQNPLEFF